MKDLPVWCESKIAKSQFSLGCEPKPLRMFFLSEEVFLPVHIIRRPSDIETVETLNKAFSISGRDLTVRRIVYFDIEKDVRISYERNQEESTDFVHAWSYSETKLSSTN